MKEVLETLAMPKPKSECAYKSALEIILALCEKMDYKTSDVNTIQTICETVLKGEH